MSNWIHPDVAVELLRSGETPNEGKWSKYDRRRVLTKHKVKRTTGPFKGYRYWKPAVLELSKRLNKDFN